MDHFKISEHSHHLHLEFHAPGAGNAFGLDVARELAGVVKQFKKWRKPVMVTSGHPSLFCSGGNLSDYKKLKGKSAGLKINRQIERVLDGFGAWPVIKFAVIEGDVLGGGIEWLARFDLRWAAPHVLLGFWQRRIGLSSGWGGGSAWAELIGEARVRRLMTEARILSSNQALEAGVVDQVLSAWRIRDEAVARCADLDNEAARRLCDWSARGEARIFSSLWMAEEHKKALQRWKG